MNKNTIVSNYVNLLSKSNINTLYAVSNITKQQIPIMKRTFLNVTSTSTSVSSSLLCYNQNSLLNQGNLLNNINTRVAYRFNSTEANSGKETKKDEKKEEKKEEEKKEDKKEPEMDPVVKKLFESKDKKISDLQVYI